MPTRSDNLKKVRCLALLLLLIGSPALAERTAISLAPHLTELAFAAGAGDQLVGVVAWSDYPEAATALPEIGDAFRFDLEKIMAVRPDLALAWRGGTPVQATQRLEELGIEVVWIEVRQLDDIAEAMDQIGQLLGSPTQAGAAAAQFRAQLAGRRADAPGEATVGVFYQVSARPLYTLGGRHVINEVLAICGAYNIFGALDTEATVVDVEAVIAAAPDLIIAGAEPGQDTGLERWRAGQLPSRQTRLLRADPTLLVRPTPRIIEGLDWLCRQIDQPADTAAGRKAGR